MPYADWAGVARDLMSALDRLEDREFLIMGEPCHGSGTRRGLFRRARPEPTRYVQVLRIDEVLFAECVGAVSLGGTWQMGEPTIEQLRRLGWVTAAERRAEVGDPTPNFDLYADIEAAGALPDLLVASLAVLGAVPEELVLESSGGGASELVG